ncbi:hypothetical protein [Actinomyces qiguomingii]|uniref:hypothetical protein n=1 Tax=Actinomyces qiguomingii TaxID=2057800 RepID=UPI001E5869CF|nr:hypothetical protein [Actinomyces qiguomingii]
MTAAPRPVPRPESEAARTPVPDLAAKLETIAGLPLEERATQLASLHELLSSELRLTEH